MKKSAKIITLVLSLALVLGAAIGFAVSAETAESATTAPVMLKKNVKSNGNFCLIFALDPATCGDTIAVEAYNTVTKETENSSAALIEKFTVQKAEALRNDQNIDINEDGINDEIVMIETNIGVEAADIADTWHVYFTSNELTTHVEYSVKDYAFERLYKDFTILENDSTTKAYRQKQFYLSILDIGSTAQNLLVNWDTSTNAPVATPERLAKEYSYAAIQGGTFNDGLEGSYVEIGDILTLTQSADNTQESWKVYTYDTNGNLVGAPSTVEITDGSATVTVAGNTVIVPGWAEGLTPGKYFADIGDDTLSFDNVTAIGDTTLITNTTAAGVSQGHNAIIAQEGRGNILNIGKTSEQGGKGRLYIPVVNKVVDGGTASCLVIETDIYVDGQMQYNTAGNPAKDTAMTLYVSNLEAAVGTGNNWNSADTLMSSNFQIYDDSGNVTADNLQGGTYMMVNDIAAFEMNRWYNLCLEVYEAGHVKIFIDGEYVGMWDVSYSNTFSDAKSINFALPERFRPSEVYFDNLFVGLIDKTYVAEE